MKETRNVYSILVGKTCGKNHYGDTGINERIIHWFLEKCGVRMLK
jgi:hypothetical protein